MFDPRDFEEQLKKAVFGELNKNRGALAKQIASNSDISRARCPEHNIGPQNIRIAPFAPSQTESKMTFDVCCEKLQKEIERILAK